MFSTIMFAVVVLFQAKVNGFTNEKMKDSQTLINAEQIEMDAMENTLDPPSKV